MPPEHHSHEHGHEHGSDPAGGSEAPPEDLGFETTEAAHLFAEHRAFGFGYPLLGERISRPPRRRKRGDQFIAEATELAEGDLVRLAGARNQPEAEFMQGLLLEEGVPSLLRRSAGFDVPDFLAAGPRDVLVPEAGAQTAREVLLEADLLGPGPPGPPVAPGRLLAGLLCALLAGAVVIWLVSELLR